MSRLDDVITDVAYILDTLMVYRSMCQTGSCNSCGNRKRCVYIPEPGESVRYNCPFYKEVRNENE